MPSLRPSTGPVSPRWAPPGSPPRTCSIGNKGLVLTHGRAAPVELGRAKTLHSLSGRKQADAETPHYTCALDMLQVCDDARAGAVLNDLTSRRTTAPQTGHALHAHGQHARGRRLSAHARGQSRPRLRLAALGLRRGRVPGHDQAAPGHLRRARGRLAHQGSLVGNRRRFIRLFMDGHERHLVARRLDGATGDGPAGRRRATSEARAEAVCVTRCLTAAV